MFTKKTLCSGFLVLVIALTGCNRSPAAYVAKGNKYFEQGKYDDALLQYRNATNKDPRYAEAYYRTALVALRQSRLSDAYSLLRHTVELNPAFRQAAIQFGDLGWYVYKSLTPPPSRIYKDLSELSQRLLAGNPRDFDGLRFKAYIAIADKRVDDALAILETANSIRPFDANVVIPMAQLSIEKEDLAEAEKLLRQMIDKNPSYASAYEVLYGLYMREKRVPDAEAVLRLHIEKNPKQTGAMIQLAEHYANQHNTAAMNAVLQRLRDERSSFPGARIALSNFYIANKSFDEALPELQQAVQEDSKNEIFYRKRMVDVLIAQGKTDQAQGELDKILKRNPNDQEARFVKADLNLKSGQRAKVSDAVGIYKDLSAEQPSNADLRFNYARALLAKGDPQAARAQLSAAIQRSPGSVGPRLALAQLSVEEQRDAEALGLVNGILEQDPANDDARIVRAVAEAGLGQRENARTDLDRVLRNHPESENAELQLGLLDLAEKRYADATSIFIKYYHVGQNDVRPLEGLIRAYLSQGQPDKALALLNDEVEKSPKSAVHRFILASVAATAGKLDVAEAQYQALAAQGHDTATIELQWGRILQAKKDAQGAIEHFRTAKSLDPKNAVPAALLGSALEAAGHEAEAIASYRDALKADPNNTYALNNLAFALAEKGQDLDDALRMALNAQRLSKDDLTAADTLGWVYLKKGLTGSALQVFQNNVRKDPKNPSYRYHLAAALLANGDKLNAKEELRKALQSGPSSDEANIRQLLAKIG